MDDLFLEQETSNLRRGFVRGLCNGFEFPLKLVGFVYQLVQANLRAQLNGSQQLEDTVVQLPRNTAPFFLNSRGGDRVLEAGPAIALGLQVDPMTLLAWRILTQKKNQKCRRWRELGAAVHKDMQLRRTANKLF
jgi:hypothetical protein